MVYVFLAEGFEEIEAISVIDILRRAEIEVQTVGVGVKTVTGAHGIPVCADISMDQVTENAVAYILPGGMPGTENLYSSDALKSVIKKAYESGKYLCAICAAPIILGRLGLLNEKKACCFPGFEKELTGARVVDEPVCVDGNVITAKAAGAAHLFALKIVEILQDLKTADNIKKAMQYE